MMKNILLAIAFIFPALGFGQSITDNGSHLNIYTGRFHYLFPKEQLSLDYDEEGNGVTLKSLTNNLRLSYSDYLRFTSDSLLNDWLNKSISQRYDSIVFIYDGDILDTAKYYIWDTVYYNKYYENDGTNINKIEQ